MDIFLALAATVATGVFVDKSPPYFPIEISRTVTGPVASKLFLVVGIGILTRLALTTETWTVFHLICGLGFGLLNAVPDTTSWSIHMAGVVIMGLGFLGIAYMNAKLDLIFVAIALWIARIVFKIFIIASRMGIYDPSHLLEASKHIMYTGKTEHLEILIVFKLCGMLQWLVFYICYQVL